MTNAVPLIQLDAQHPASLISYVAASAGYDVSGAEITMALTLCGMVAAAVTHAAHLAVSGWRRVGGWDGFKTFFKSGK